MGMEELKVVMEKFVESGWDLIANSAQAWLDGKEDIKNPISTIEQAAIVVVVI